MKRENIRSIVISAFFAGILFCSSCQAETKHLNITRNYGIANFEINVANLVDEKGEVNEDMFDINQIVPQKTELIQNLKDKGYEISEYDEALNTTILAERIYASKGNHYIDICYGLSEEDAVSVFDEYESEYSEFYVMAHNGNYVYSVSDKETFKNAGFESLGNIGTQYICE